MGLLLTNLELGGPHIVGMAWEWHGNGMGMAWEWYGNGMEWHKFWCYSYEAFVQKGGTPKSCIYRWIFPFPKTIQRAWGIPIFRIHLHLMFSLHRFYSSFAYIHHIILMVGSSNFFGSCCMTIDHRCHRWNLSAKISMRLQVPDMEGDYCKVCVRWCHPAQYERERNKGCQENKHLPSGNLT